MPRTSGAARKAAKQRAKKAAKKEGKVDAYGLPIYDDGFDPLAAYRQHGKRPPPGPDAPGCERRRISGYDDALAKRAKRKDAPIDYFVEPKKGSHPFIGSDGGEYRFATRSCVVLGPTNFLRRFCVAVVTHPLCVRAKPRVRARARVRPRSPSRARRATLTGAPPPLPARNRRRAGSTKSSSR